MVISEFCDTSSVLGKGGGLPSPPLKNSDGLLPPKEGIEGAPQSSPLLGKGAGGPPMLRKGGGGPAPPPMLRKEGGGPPPPPNALFGSASPKIAMTKLKRSSEMGYSFRKLREKMEGSSLVLEKSSSAGRKKSSGNSEGAGGGNSMADALSEITTRSSYYQQIQEDVQKYGKTITEMQVSISTFQTKDMDALLKFYHQVELKLDVLTDENQVLAKFEGFPVKKLEIIRMAASLYKRLTCVVSELQNMKFEPPLPGVLDRVEKYFDKIRKEMEALERTKDEDKKTFESQKIHFDFSIHVKVKEAIVDVSSNCIELALKERRKADQTPAKTGSRQSKVDKNMLWRTFKFVYKVYTYAGGQDERAGRLAKELVKEIEFDEPMTDS